MKRLRIAVAVVLMAALATGCGEEDLIDDSQSSDAQVRSLVAQFQTAAAEEDDQAACDLMNDQMRGNTAGTNAEVNGELTVLPCGVVAALWDPNRELPSLPGAKVVYVAIDRHDSSADVQLDNGTRFYLRRAGGSADGEWRINSMGYRPSPEDWKDQLRLSQPVTQQDLIACLRKSGLGASLDETFSGTTKDGLRFEAKTIQLGSHKRPDATLLVLEQGDAARVADTPGPAGIKLRQPFGEKIAANAYLRGPLVPQTPIDFVRPAPQARDEVRSKVVPCAE